MSINIVRFRAPGPPVSLNENKGGTRSYLQRRKVHPWRSRTAQEVAEQLRVPLVTRFHDPRPVLVGITLPFTTARRRDPHNYALIVKAMVDGVVDAGWVPDDTPEWVTTTEPVLVVGRDELVVLTLADRVSA